MTEQTMQTESRASATKIGILRGIFGPVRGSTTPDVIIGKKKLRFGNGR
jgi:hypothetical protein